MPHLASASLDTPIGQLWLGGSAAGLRWIRRTEHPEHLSGRPDPEALADATGQLAAYFSGTLRNFSLQLDLTGVTPFDVAVWTAASDIPYGETRSYGGLAARIGAPRAARAVGGAMARCSLAPVVPCHRVIRADGSLGGWGADPWVKRWLLRHEAERR